MRKTTNSMLNLNKHILLAFVYFIIAAFFGVLLRSFNAVELPINYRFVVHTHSHIALLGWVYVVLTTLLYKLFLNKSELERKYRKLFLFTQITLVGMLLTFPFQGYALFSIIFSTLFLIASYWFSWFFIKHTPINVKNLFSYKCIKWSLFYLVLSSIGPWALGAIMTLLGPLSIWYRLAIYFYLHFLYNGWMLLTLIGFFFYVLEKNQIFIGEKNLKFFFWSLNIGIVLSFLLSTLWTEPLLIFNVIGALGAILQLGAFIIFIYWFREPTMQVLEIFNPFQKGILRTVVYLLVIKMVLQLLTSVPYFSMLVANYLDFTIGYLHLTFLGVVTLSIFLFLDYFQIFKIAKVPYYIYLIAFLITEMFIFYKGFAAWQKFSIFENYHDVLALISFVIPVSLFLIIVLREKIYTK